MYRHILIPTDGSELAEHAVTNGLSLAKSVGAKVTVIIVHEAPADATLSFLEQVEKHAVSVLNRAADAAKQAGVPCDTNAGGERATLSSHYCSGLGQGLRSHRHGIARARRAVRNRARQCDKQGPNAHENPRYGVSLNARAGRFGRHPQRRGSTQSRDL